MAKTQYAQVVITANAAVAKQIMQELEQRTQALKAKMASLDTTTKEGKKEFAALEKQLMAYNSATTQNIKNTDRVRAAIMNLANTPLKELRRALSAAKSELNKFAENGDTVRLKQTQNHIKALQQQIKLLEGEYVNIKKHIGELNTVSDQWLTKAIAQQQKVLAQTEQGTAAYARQHAQLVKLHAEQTKRAINTINSGRASATELREARGVVQSARDNMSGLSVAGIASMNNAITSAQRQIDAFEPKVQKAQLSWRQMREVMNAPMRANRDQLKQTIDHLTQMQNRLPVGSRLFQQLDAKIKGLQKSMQGVANSAVSVARVMRNIKTAPLDQLKAAAQRLEGEIEKLSRSDARHIQILERKQQQLAKLRGEIAAQTGTMTKQSNAFATTIRNISAYFGLFQVVSKAISLWNTFLKKNFQLSDSMADIRKVSLMAYEDIAKLEGALAKLDTRTNLEGLNKILYAGAKLGMSKYGIEGMQSFVKASNQVNVALREDLGDEALTALSKFTEVMGLIPKLGVERAMLKTGSAIFKLAATSTASAGPIINFSKRLTGVARTAGITADQILALGSAADSMMLMPEVASTAFSKLITSLQRNPKAIEKSLGMEEGTINDLFKSGNAMEAIVKILQAMHDKGNMHALNDVFKDLGSDGARLISVMVTMAKNVKMLEGHLEEAKTAFEDGYAVTQEYLIQQETAQALMERAGNLWEKAFVNPEGVDNVKEMAKAWYNVSKQLTTSEASMTVLGGVLKTFLYLITSAIKYLPALLVALGARGLMGALIGIKGALIGVGEASIFATRTGTGFVATLKAMKASMVANWVTFFILAIAELYVYFKDLNRETPKTVKYMEGFKKVADALDGSYGKEAGRLKSLTDDINRLGQKSKERLSLISEFNKRYKPYLDHLLTEKSTAQEVAAAYKEVNKQLQMKSLLELKQEDYEKYYNPAVRRSMERMETFGRLGGHKEQLHGWLLDAIDTQTKPGGLKIGDSSLAKALAKKMGVSQDFVSTAMKYRSAPNVPTKAEDIVKQKNVSVGGTTYSSPEVVKGREFTKQEQQYIAALQTATQYYSTANVNSKLWQKWKFLKLDELKEELGDLDDDNNGPKEITNPDDQARNHISEFLTQIKEYYTRQKTAILEDMTANGIEKDLQDLAVADLDARMQEVLGYAHEGIVKENEAWEKGKERIQKDLHEMADENGYNRSQDLLTALLDTDAAALGKELDVRIAKIKHSKKSGDKIIGWKPEDSDELLRARLMNETAKGENKTANAEMRRKENVRKELLEYNFTGKVQENAFLNFAKNGFADVSPLSDTFEKDKQRIIDMLEDARQNIYDVMAVGPTDKRGLLSLLFGKDYEKELEGTTLAPLLDLWANDWQLFYDKLIQYSEEYTAAEKQQSEKRKKMYEYMWEHSSTYDLRNNQINDTQAVIDSNKLLPNKGRKWTQANGFRNNFDDPEIKLLQIKMQLEAEHLQHMIKMGATEAELAEQWRNAADAANEYSQRIMESISERMEMMEQWTDPIVTFGGAMGEAFAKMGEDAEEGAQAVQDALKDMLRSWGEITIRIIAERMAQSMQQSFYNQMEESEEESHQEKMSDIRTSGGKKGRNTAISVAKSILNAKLQWNKKEKKQDEQTQNDITDSRADAADAMVGIEKNAGSAMLSAAIQTGSTLLATKKAQDQAEIQENAGKTEANVTMSLADALGKCFAQLGPVGGAIAAAGVEALLMGLLNWALSKAFSSKSSSASSAPKINTKLVSGMLTYDQGNLKQMYLGNDGKLYAAKSEEQLPTGIVTQPVATTINGQPSLVGERGPELVVGRETTAAMMQNAPQLLQALLDYDKNHRLGALPAYDRGNVASVVTDAPVTTASPQSGISEELLTQLLYYLQHPVAPNINMYGREGLHAKMQQADRFMKGK